MVDAGQANLAVLMVGGAWVEGMYLTLSVSESGAHLSGFESVLLDQKKSFELFEGWLPRLMQTRLSDVFLHRCSRYVMYTQI
jgi:hypothetical protein